LPAKNGSKCSKLKTKKSIRTLKISERKIHPLSKNRKTIENPKLNVKGLN